MTQTNDLSALANSIADMTSPFRRYLSELHEKYQGLTDGHLADYIPELASADPNLFGICVITTN
ncbi:MAG: glutaminase A, partial [Cyanobacteria bacterium J06627_8]